jgi:hypothetical protein
LLTGTGGDPLGLDGPFYRGGDDSLEGTDPALVVEIGAQSRARRVGQAHGQLRREAHGRVGRTAGDLESVDDPLLVQSAPHPLQPGFA